MENDLNSINVDTDNNESEPDKKNIQNNAQKQAEDEWALVEKMQNNREDQSQKIGVEKYTKSKEYFISYEDSFEYFKQKDLTEEKKSIIVEDRQSQGCLGNLLATKLKTKELLDERDLIFSIAKVPLDSQEEEQNKMICTIFMKLTGNKIQPGRIGSHWEIIGFQGGDPATDLRGVGMLGILQLLFLIDNYSDISEEIYNLSRNEAQNFPFCVASLGITKLSLETMREGKLIKPSNSIKSVILTVNKFYVAAFFYQFQIWKKEHKTIVDFGEVSHRVKAAAKKNPIGMMKELNIYLDEEKKRKTEKYQFADL